MFELQKLLRGTYSIKFGATRQLEYRIGDKIAWGYNEIGKSGIAKVKVYGILEIDDCPKCGNEEKNNKFDILIQEDVIKSISVMIEYDYSENGEYEILEE